MTDEVFKLPPLDLFQMAKKPSGNKVTDRDKKHAEMIAQYLNGEIDSGTNLSPEIQGMVVKHLMSFAKHMDERGPMQDKHFSNDMRTSDGELSADDVKKIMETQSGVKRGGGTFEHSPFVALAERYQTDWLAKRTGM